MSGPVEPPAAPVAAQGQVFDRGYRHYEGPREGRGHAIRALIAYSIKRGLGIKKRWTAKIIPFVLYAAAFLPVIVIIGIRALAGQLAQGFGYGTLFGALSMILLVFTAATAPEMLADDRRQNVLSLYFSRPISRADYLLAKVAALGILMGTISLLPALTLYLGTALLDASPAGYVVSHLGVLLRILITGSLLALYFAAIGLLIASFTDRKAVAAAIYIGAVLVLSGIAAALYQVIDPGVRSYVVLFDPLAIPQGIAGWVLQYRPSGGSLAGRSRVGGGWYLIDVLVITAVSALVMYRRYLRHA